MKDKKIKLACYCACGCGGCDTAILDTGLKILELSSAADIVFWPMAVDAKEHDVREMPDGGIDLCLFNGSIRNSENREMAFLLRKKSAVMVAFGACAWTGGISGMLNTTNARSVMETVFAGVPGCEPGNGGFPASRIDVDGHELLLPELLDEVCALDGVVDVDYYVPGCPPAPQRITEVIDAVVGGNLPGKGAVLGASDKALCSTCPRTINGTTVDGFERPHLTSLDPDACFLEQGVVCMGPVTRAGCQEACLRGNMPCTGCYGATPGAGDTGAALVGRLAALIDSNDPEAVDRIAGELTDLVGSLYRFTFADSVLKKVKK